MKLLQGLSSVSLSDRAYLPDSAGVYIAATTDQIFYVGQSGNMRDRWTQHHQLDRLMGFPGVRLYYLLVPQGFCGQLESALIRQFAPQLNGNNGEVPLGDRVASQESRLSVAKVVHVVDPGSVQLIEYYREKAEMYRDEVAMLRRRQGDLAGRPMPVPPMVRPIQP